MATSEKLTNIDKWLYEFLLDAFEIMPMRLVKLIANYYTDARVRKIYWKRIGIEMGEGTYANLGLRIATNENRIHVKIGNFVSIAPNVTFVVDSTANNGKEINKLPYVRDVLTKSGDIVVDDEVWIGASVTILPGVHIGKCSVIGAGSLVLADVEPYSIYVGVPAKKIRNLRTGKRI